MPFVLLLALIALLLWPTEEAEGGMGEEGGPVADEPNGPQLAPEDGPLREAA
jgi:hypothetical protein